MLLASALIKEASQTLGYFTTAFSNYLQTAFVFANLGKR